MNWTGGSLRRHSKKANKDVVNRQKAHFARVRTALQNGSKPLSAPFIPSYFQDDDVGLGGRLPAFGSGSVRHAGRSRRLQEQRESEASPPRGQDHGRLPGESDGLRGGAVSRRGRAKSYQKATRYASASPVGHGRDGEGGASRGKRKASDFGVEERLLEANRRRLLERQGWVEMALSRPVNMQFTPREEKGRIGKRRKVDGRARPRPGTKENQPGLYKGDARNRDTNDIRIRIGTDALSSQPQMQRKSHAQSSDPGTSQGDSSDLMLLDQEDPYPAPKEPLQPPRSVSENQSISAGAPLGKHVNSQRPPAEGRGRRMCSPSSCHQLSAGFGGGLCAPQFAEGANMGPDPILRSVGRFGPANARPQKEEIDSDFHLTQYVGGTGRRSLRFIFDHPSDVPAHISGQEEVQADIDDNTLGHGQANAGLSRVGHPRSKEGKEHENKEPASPPSIVDDAPWREFVAIPDDSPSHSATAMSRPASPRPPSLVNQDGFDSGRAVWSQHATLGDQTCISSSSAFSASLPSIRHTDDQSVSGDQPRVQGESSDSTTMGQSHHMDDNERLWRAFVFEGDDNLASETMHGDRVGDGMMRAASLREWSNMASCVAVASSVGSSLLPTRMQQPTHLA